MPILAAILTTSSSTIKSTNSTAHSISVCSTIFETILDAVLNPDDNTNIASDRFSITETFLPTIVTTKYPTIAYPKHIAKLSTVCITQYSKWTADHNTIWTNRKTIFYSHQPLCAAIIYTFSSAWWINLMYSLRSGLLFFVDRIDSMQTGASRFDRLSFERQEVYIRTAVQRLKDFTQILDSDIVKLLADRVKKNLSEVPLSSTTKGAKAPIELFVDSFVLGVAILFINSNYNFLWAITFQEMNKSTVLRIWLQLKTLFSANFIISGMIYLISSTNPFIIMLRFLLSFVNVGAFFERDRISHVISPACIGIEGFQNQELLLVNATSILV
eukprot:gene24876-biopygen16161